MAENTVVQTKSGTLQGSFEKGLYVFKGVPYAAPPIGERRWLPPIPVHPWQGIRPALNFGSVAPQLQSRLEQILPGPEEAEPQSEDCLFLNIWTPGTDKARRPVMVWIHGGGFSMGSGSHLNYRGGPLVSRGNIVLVTINYRLGVLGFINLNEITNGKIAATGNEGLLDQVAALEWVRDNIAEFGGDPTNVTIFGESAGGMSVGCLMNLPKAQGLFQKAIIESAVGEMAVPLEKAVNTAGIFLDVVNMKPGNAESLKTLSTQQILNAQQELMVRTGMGIAPAIPVADGKVMPIMPLDSFKAGRAARVPMIMGSNLDEQRLFAAVAPGPKEIDESSLVQRVSNMVPAGFVEKVIAVYREGRTRRGETATPFAIWSAIDTDMRFRMVALRGVEGQCRINQSAYNYLFTWKSPMMDGWLGACHALEIGFVFGRVNDKFCGGGPEAKKLSLTVQDAWTAFARTGDPSTPVLNWPQYCQDRQTMVFDKKSRVEKAVYEDERQVWDEIGLYW
jgi:para-nitrobenzyl esterase